MVEGPNETNADIAFILGRLEGKVDTLLAIRAEQSEAIGDLSIRVSSLERSRAYITGAIFVLASVFSAGAGWLADQFNLISIGR